MTDIQQAQLWQALQGSAPHGGLWNGRKVAEWISELIGQPVDRHRGWEYLRQMTFRLRVPRPAHSATRKKVEQEEWKKKLALVVAKIQAEHPQAQVELWTMDEHRRSSQTDSKAGLGGTGATANYPCVFWRFQWLWLYGFVHPESGETKRVDTAQSQHRAIQLSYWRTSLNTLVWGKTSVLSWQWIKQVGTPVNSGLGSVKVSLREFMPSHSPEFLPAERLWPLTNEPIVNQSFETLDELEEVLWRALPSLAIGSKT